MRTSRKDVERVFKRLVDACGRHVAESYNDVGGWQLDFNSVYGGFVIEEIVTASGGVSHPFGDSRLKAGPFVDAMRFAERALDLK
jgi:hypothetical protein